MREESLAVENTLIQSWPAKSATTLHQRTLALQAESPGAGVRLAGEIIPHPLFQEKFRTALVLVMRARRRDHHLAAEVTQEALRTIHQYLVGKGLVDYTDHGEDEFGGWLFVLCRRHIAWAKLRLQRQSLPMSNQDLSEARECREHSVPERHYEQALALVVGTINGFQEPLRGVMRDDLDSLSCRESAEFRGITTNYVAILRTKGRAILRRILSEQITAALA